MARVFIDSFEAGQLDLWDGLTGTTINSSSLMKGTYCAYLPYGTSAYLHKIVPSDDEYYLAFRYRPSSVSAGCKILEFRNGTTIIGTLKQKSGGNLEVYRGDAATLLATGTAVLTANMMHLIEVRYKPHTSTGAFEVKVNSAADITYSGNTTPGATAIDGIRFKNDSPGTVHQYIDNVIIDNATFPGDTEIQAIKPTAAGSSIQWDPSSGSNWDCVEEVPASDTDFISTNVADEVDLFVTGDLVGSIDAVKCVQVQARCLKEGTPTPENLQLACRSGGTNYFGGNNAVPSTAQSFAKLWETNPNTGAAWTVSEVNAAEIGVKAAA